MEIIIILVTLGAVIWLLSRLKKAPPTIPQESLPPPKTEETKTYPNSDNTGLGRGLAALIPTSDDEPQEFPKQPVQTPTVYEPELPVDEFKTYAEHWEKQEEIVPPEADPDELVLWPGVEDALDSFFSAGLFPDYRDKSVLSLLIRERFKILKTLPDWNYWHHAQEAPVESRHPWTDIGMLLSFGPKAGYAFFNIYQDGLSTETLNTFGQACYQLSRGQLNVDIIEWTLIEDEVYQLRVGQKNLEYDAKTQPLWSVPLQFVKSLNDLLPDKELQFEVVSMLPIYGETFVFYLTTAQKKILENERNWLFFDWKDLEGGEHA